MSRLVRPARAVGPAGGLGDAPPALGLPQDLKDAGDTYLARVGKYIPSEVVAFVIFTNGVLQQSITNAAKAGSGANSIATMAGFNVVDIGALILAGAWLITPIYLWRLKAPGDAWRTNAFLAFLLFPIWAYAVDGVGMRKFIEFDGYLASIVLGAATLASGLVKPSAETKPDNPP